MRTVCGVFLFFIFLNFFTVILAWDLSYDSTLYSDKCNIKRVTHKMTELEFDMVYKQKIPFILTNVNNNAFKFFTEKVNEF